MNKLISLILLSYTICFLISCKKQVEIQAADETKFIVMNYLDYLQNKGDPVSIVQVNIMDDFLKINLRYSGGCKEHFVELVLIQTLSKTAELSTPTFAIRHNSNNDACKALITKEYTFDISGLREQGKRKTDFILISVNSSGEITNATYTYNY